MGTPAAGYHETFAHSRQGDGANDRHHLTAANIQPQHCIAIFIILVYYRTDCALYNLHFLLHGLPLHSFAPDGLNPVKDSLRLCAGHQISVTCITFYLSFILQHFTGNEKGIHESFTKNWKNLHSKAYLSFGILSKIHQINCARCKYCIFSKGKI
jgi:hypothetical protein